eukprot:4369665-Prymnesium_polylepis.1
MSIVMLSIMSIIMSTIMSIIMSIVIMSIMLTFMPVIMPVIMVIIACPRRPATSSARTGTTCSRRPCVPTSPSPSERQAARDARASRVGPHVTPHDPTPHDPA